MIHELLFALRDCRGCLFKEDEWNIEQGFNIPIEWKEFIHPADYKLIQNIMKIGARHHKLMKFYSTVMDQGLVQFTGGGEYSETRPSIHPGLYLKAFCNGLYEVLEDYRNELDCLEDAYLKHPQLTLTYILGKVSKHNWTLDVLISMVGIIETESTHGTPLMSTLQNYQYYGTPSITSAAEKVLMSINKIFYRQLANWMVYGDLVDTFNEFFIEDCKCDDENFLYPEQIENKDSRENNEVASMPSLCTSKKYTITRKTWRIHKFAIRYQMLPSIIPLELAETILFIGRTIWILQNDPNQDNDVTKEKSKRDVWEKNSLQYYKKVQDLDKYPFSYSLVSKPINECRLKLTEYLWKVMVEEAKFLEHLQLIRDYYALGRGELFQELIIASKDHLKTQNLDHAANMLNAHFHELARKLYSENDGSYLKFHLCFDKDNEYRDKDKGCNQLLYLELYMDVNWPLHIIFHPKVITCYNKLFSFLMRVRKTHINLHQLWLKHSKQKKIDRNLWQLRHTLMFLINNIQYYLQVDVIEAQFSLLITAVKSSNEFNDIIRLHSTFLGNLLSKTFVMTLSQDTNCTDHQGLYQLPNFNLNDKNTVYNIILMLLELCDEFCLVASLWSEELSTSEHEILQEFHKRSNTLVESLLSFLHGLYNQGSNAYLLQLLNRLDFNRIYSNSNFDFNLTTS